MIPAAGHARFREWVERSDEFVLATHMNPDGDALGSEFGLAAFLLERGKRVRIINSDPTPETLRFIERDVPVIECYDPATHDAVLAAADCVVLVDNSAPDRLGALETAMRRVASRTLCIDHHPAREMPWAGQIVDETACATTVMIYELTRGCGWTPELRAAEAIFVGLVTDTGFFRFNSTNPRAHTVASELLAIGVRPARVYREVYERNSLAYTRLLGHALSRLATRSEGQVVWVTLDRAAIDRYGAADVDTSEMTTALLAIDGVAVALLFRELTGERVKVSLRSKGLLDVHRLAGEFGGGGHRNASGIVMPGTLDAVVATVTDRAEDLLRELTPPR